MFLVSPTDRELLQILSAKSSAISHSMCESYGADVLAVIEGRGHLAIQRKQFPDDFIASIEDGRMAREIALLQYAEFPVLIAEGWAEFTSEGHLMLQHGGRWTKQALRNTMRSMYKIHGIAVERTDNINDTADAVIELEAYFGKEIHKSLLTRPKRVMQDTWGLSNKRDFARFFLQGFPGVGSALAEQIFDHFGKIPLRWDADEDELKEVYGIGEKRAKVLWEMLQ